MLLSKYKVRDLPLATEVVTLKHPDQRLFDAIEVLSARHLLSAPVLDESGKLYGLLDALDIVTFVVNEAAKGNVFQDADISTVMGIGHASRSSCAQVSLDDGVDKVLDIISGPARRAVVIGPTGCPYSIVTQSVLLQFLKSKLDEFQGLKQCGTAKEHCSSGVAAVKESDTALQAFEAIRQLGVSSLAILSEDGTMTTVVSATDLVVGLAHMLDKSRVLAELRTTSVLDFVALNRRLDTKARASTVAVRPDAPIAAVIEKLAACRVHRVIVCMDNKPIGVLSLTDICRAAASASAAAAAAGQAQDAQDS